MHLHGYSLVLGSSSPRRRQLFHEMGFEFQVRSAPVEETYPDDLPKAQVAEYLAKKKAEAARADLQAHELLVTADTTVRLGEELLEKPAEEAEAARMLAKLSGKTHEVATGVCLTSPDKQVAFTEVTAVTFRELTAGEIRRYIDEHSPYDKAGAYAVQEWIGMVGITRLEGSYYNVVGLPTERLYRELLGF